MEHVTHECADLNVEFDLADKSNQAVEYRAAMRGYPSGVLFEGSHYHMYRSTLAIMTSVFTDVIRMVHFDGDLLHVFLDKTFPKGKLKLLCRIFESTSYLPDTVLSDILKTGQAVLSQHQQIGADLHVIQFHELEPYEGPVDISYLQETMEKSNIDWTNLCSVVMRVGRVDTHVYHDAQAVLTPVVDQKGEVDNVDFFHMARRCHRDVLFVSHTIAKIERYFRKTKFKAVKR